MHPPAPELCLFGVARLQRADQLLHLGARKAIALLAVLAVDGPSSRARLAALLWPNLDDGAARRNLRRELSTAAPPSRASNAPVRWRGRSVMCRSSGPRSSTS